MENVSYKKAPRRTSLRSAISQFQHLLLADENGFQPILTQVAAVESALQAFGYCILEEHLQTCVADGVRQGDPEILGEALTLIKKLK